MDFSSTNLFKAHEEEQTGRGILSVPETELYTQMQAVKTAETRAKKANKWSWQNQTPCQNETLYQAATYWK